MKKLAEDAITKNRNVIADFVCPTEKTRQDFGADYTIWMDTIKQGRFEDTNRIFVPPKKFEFKVTSLNAELWSEQIIKDLKKRVIEVLYYESDYFMWGSWIKIRR